MLRVSFLFFLTLFVFAAHAVKKEKLTPYQSQLQMCLDPKIDVSKINNNKALYKTMSSFYSLVFSKTTYREVLYKQNEELKKLKFDGM